MPYCIMSLNNPTNNGTGYVSVIEGLGTFADRELAEQKRRDYLNVFTKIEPVNVQVIEYVSKEDGI